MKTTIFMPKKINVGYQKRMESALDKLLSEEKVKELQINEIAKLLGE